MLAVSGCARGYPVVAVQQEPLPPLPDRQDFTLANRAGIANFLASDPGWQAWLFAWAASDAVNSALVDASTANVPAGDLTAELTMAKDSYRRATSFYLTPVTVRSSCLDLPSETTGAVRLTNGLVARYTAYASSREVFPNGASCLRSTGFVSEIDSARGLTIVTAAPPADIDWTANFARALAWYRPFKQISQTGSYSVSDLIALIGQ